MAITLPRHSLDLVEAPSWSVRPEQPIDLDQIHDLHREAFHRASEAELVDAIRSGPDFIPELSLVAVTADDSVLGHILISRVAFNADVEQDARDTVLALAPLAVLPPYQCQGIGSALMRQALATADEREEPMTAVLGSRPYYSRFGFVPADELGVSGPFAEAGEAFQVRPRPGAERLVPGTVIYPPKFEGI